MTTDPATSSAKNVRRGLLLWAIGLVGLAILYHQAWAYWFRLLWTQPEESVGLLVPFVVGFLVWLRRDALRATPARPSVAGAMAFAIAVAITALGELLWFRTGVRFGLYCAILALTWTAWGTRWIRVLAVPLIFLFFVQPLPITLSDAITHPLRLIVTEHAARLLSLGGLPAIAEGVFLHMPAATLETTAACSGIRGFVASLALALLIADVVRGPRITTALLFPGGLMLVFLFNILRVMIAGMWTTLHGSPSSDSVHAATGLVMFAGVATILALWQLKTSERFA